MVIFDYGLISVDINFGQFTLWYCVLGRGDISVLCSSKSYLVI